MKAYPEVPAFKCQYLSFASMFKRFMEDRITKIKRKQDEIAKKALDDLEDDIKKVRKRQADIDKAPQSEQADWFNYDKKYTAYARKKRDDWVMKAEITWPPEPKVEIDPSCEKDTPVPKDFACNFLRQCIGFDCPDELPQIACVGGFCGCTTH